MSRSAEGSPRARASARARTPLSLSPAHLTVRPHGARENSPLRQLIEIPSVGLSPRSRPLQSLRNALNSPYAPAAVAGRSNDDFVVRADGPSCSMVQGAAEAQPAAALKHELRTLSAEVRGGQARQEARHQEIMGAMQQIASGMMAPRQAPAAAPNLRSHLGIGAPPGRGAASNGSRPMLPQFDVSPPTPFKNARSAPSNAAPPSAASAFATVAPPAEPAFALTQPSVRISILTLLDGSQISLCISRSDTPTPLPENGSLDPRSPDYRKFLIPTATLLSSLQKTYDFVLSSRRPAPPQPNLSAPGTLPGYATMPGMTNQSQMRSRAPAMAEQSAAIMTPHLLDPSSERTRQDSLKRAFEEEAVGAASSVIKPKRFHRNRRSQPHTGGLETASPPKDAQPRKGDSSASGFRLRWPNYDAPSQAQQGEVSPVELHRPQSPPNLSLNLTPQERGFRSDTDNPSSFSATRSSQVPTAERAVAGPPYNGHATMPVPAGTSSGAQHGAASARQVSLENMARATERHSEPTTPLQQAGPTAASQVHDASSPEASAAELQEERQIRGNLMAALLDAGFGEMGHEDRVELLISTCLAQHRGAKRRLMLLQRANETANKETHTAREAEARANALVQHLQLEMRRKQEESDARRSSLERNNAELQTELQQMRAHAQRMEAHAMHSDYLRLGPESAEQSQDAFQRNSSEEQAQQPQQVQQQAPQLLPQRYDGQQMLAPHGHASRSAPSAESSLSDAMRGLESAARPGLQHRALSLQTGRTMEELYGALSGGASGGSAGQATQLPQMADPAFQELMNASSRANDDIRMHQTTAQNGQAHEGSPQTPSPHQQEQQQQQQFQQFQQQQQPGAERTSHDGAIATLANGASESHVRAEPNDV